MAERTFQGIGVSPGVARGRIYIYGMAEEVVPEYDVAPDVLCQDLNELAGQLLAHGLLKVCDAQP